MIRDPVETKPSRRLPALALSALAAVSQACARPHVASGPVVSANAARDSAPTPDGRLAWSVLHESGPATPLRPQDWRWQYTGLWHVTITVDSVQELVDEGGGSRRSVMRPLSPASVARGTLVIRDTVVHLPRLGDVLPARLDVDFSVLHGGPIAWFGQIALERSRSLQRDTYSLWLSPGCFECGASAVMTGDEGSLSGVWCESAYVGYSREGRLILTRGAGP